MNNGPKPEDLQQDAKQKYPNIAGQGLVGQFKQIIPTQENIAVAVVKAAQGETAKERLEHEAYLLNYLREQGFPAIQTYGEVFEVAPGRHALMMDYVPDATLLDGKSIDTLKFSIPGMVLGVPVNTGHEAWAMQLPTIMRNIEEAALISDLEQVKTFAKTLGEQAAQLVKTVQEKMLMVGDLQILVDRKGKITIIDPLDVLKVVPRPDRRGVDFVDIVDPKKQNTSGFLQSLDISMEMLDRVQKLCVEIGKAKDKVDLRNIVQTMMNPDPKNTIRNPLTASAPPSPVLARRPQVSDPRQSRSLPGSVSSTPSIPVRNGPNRASDYDHRPPPITQAANAAARRSLPTTATARPTGTEPTKPNSSIPTTTTTTTDTPQGKKPKV